VPTHGRTPFHVLALPVVTVTLISRPAESKGS
jgi:hypothetical protein